MKQYSKRKVQVEATLTTAKIKNGPLPENSAFLHGSKSSTSLAWNIGASFAYDFTGYIALALGDRFDPPQFFVASEKLVVCPFFDITLEYS